MPRKKKKKHDEEHIDETWLIPYADLLTLLLALFIVLFSMSSIDASKFRQLAKSFQSSFDGGTGVLKYPSPLPQEELESLNKEDENNEPSEEQTFEEIERNELKKLQEKLNGYIEANNLQLDLQTKLTDEGLMLTIKNDILFESGSIEISSKDKKLAKEISELLVMKKQREVIISGHTDNVPISNEQFDSNWHLSVMRAVSFMKLLLANPNLDPRWYSAKGFGEYKPIASNETEEGRAKNRRVEILILADKQEE